MTEPNTAHSGPGDGPVKFSSRHEFQALLAVCLERATLQLQLFDADYALWNLGSSANDTLLRRFLAGGGQLRLVAHNNGYLERDCPRLLRLLKDYGHRIECRLTPKSLRHLTDSFCLADGRHIVRRFHQDHLRGEAVFNTPPATELSAERFAGIWAESTSGLQASTTGL
jgi:hypothetical protein